MVEVGVEEERVVLLEHGAELGGDALRADDRHARADAHDLDVIDGAHAGEDLLELVVGEHQRVAAADQHVAHLGRALDVLDGVVDLVLGDEVLGAADQAAPGAVAAVHRAHLGDHEQHAVGVAVRDARRRRVEVLGDGVLQVLGAHDELGRRGHALHAHRAVRVVGVHERGVVGRDRHAELAHAGLEVGALLGGQVEHLLEVGDRGQPVGELPAIVVPLLGGHVFEAGDLFPVPGRRLYAHVVSSSRRPPAIRALASGRPASPATRDAPAAERAAGARVAHGRLHAALHVGHNPAVAMIRRSVARFSASSGGTSWPALSGAGQLRRPLRRTAPALAPPRLVGAAVEQARPPDVLHVAPGVLLGERVAADADGRDRLEGDGLVVDRDAGRRPRPRSTRSRRRARAARASTRCRRRCGRRRPAGPRRRAPPPGRRAVPSAAASHSSAAGRVGGKPAAMGRPAWAASWASWVKVATPAVPQAEARRVLLDGARQRRHVVGRAGRGELLRPHRPPGPRRGRRRALRRDSPGPRRRAPAR